MGGCLRYTNDFFFSFPIILFTLFILIPRYGNMQVYYSEETDYVPVEMIKGKCEVVKKRDLPSSDVPAIVEHTFFCERQFDRSNGSLKLVT